MEARDYLRSINQMLRAAAERRDLAELAAIEQAIDDMVITHELRRMQEQRASNEQWMTDVRRIHESLMRIDFSQN